MADGSMHALLKGDSHLAAGIWAKCCQVVWVSRETKNMNFYIKFLIFQNLLQARKNICEPNSAQELWMNKQSHSSLEGWEGRSLRKLIL